MITRGYKTCLIYHVNEGLCVVPEEATDRVALILTREDHFDQGGDFMQSECGSDQTSAGWNVEVEKGGVISALYKGGAEDIPSPDPGVVAVS